MTLPGEFYTIIKGVWPMSLIFIVVLSAVRITYVIQKKERFVFYKEFFTLLFIVYILLLFELVSNTDIQGISNNFIPFKEILRYEFGSKYFIWNVVGNMVIFIPFGFIVSHILDSEKIGKPLFLTFIASLTIELVQMYIGRSFDVDDILLNCIGGALGFLLYIAIVAVRKHLPKVLQRDGVYNFLTIIIIIAIILSIFNWWGLFIK